jgi:hypothetical protein
MSALEKQVGGAHYKDMPFQPIEYILANNLGFCEGNIVKYITRYKAKGGVADLRKVIHYAELLIEAIENDSETKSQAA